MGTLHRFAGTVSFVPLSLVALACGGTPDTPVLGTGGSAAHASGGLTGAGTGGGGTSGSATGGAAGTASGGTSGAAGVAIADIPALLAPAECAAGAACYGPLFDLVVHGADCVTFLTKELQESELTLLEDAVAKGVVKYDDTKVSACIDQIKNGGCTVFQKRSLCDDVFVGSVKAGQSCSFGAECAPGLFCKTNAGCPGTCTALLAQGAACEHGSNCQDGLECSSSVCETATTFDFSGTEGAACDLGAGKVCQSGLVCAATSVVAGATAFSCEKPSTGGACHLAIPEACPAGQYCALPAGSLNGACTPVPAIGEPCGMRSPTDTGPTCPAESVCDDTSGNCVALQHLGGTCTADDQCYGQHCSAGTCAAAECPN